MSATHYVVDERYEVGGKWHRVAIRFDADDGISEYARRRAEAQEGVSPPGYSIRLRRGATHLASWTSPTMAARTTRSEGGSWHTMSLRPT
jgi:hypothetical protein